MTRTRDSGFDVVLVDKDDQTVALVEVKSQRVGDLWPTLLPRNLARYGKPVDFVLAIDPVHPESPQKRIFESYLLTLVEAWLRDLAYHWKSDARPHAHVPACYPCSNHQHADSGPHRHLILHSILERAQKFPHHAKSLLTNNVIQRLALSLRSIRRHKASSPAHSSLRAAF